MVPSSVAKRNDPLTPEAGENTGAAALPLVLTTVPVHGPGVGLPAPGGTFTVLDSKTEIPVWHFETGQDWRASPMTYMAGGRQYVVLAGQGGISSFALTQ
jgi:hypothetical protein